MSLIKKWDGHQPKDVDRLLSLSEQHQLMIDQKNETIFDLQQSLNAEESDYVMLHSKFSKLKKAIEILNRIYGFKLQDIKFSGYYELLIPDMTSDELTKEEYELLKEVLNDK